MAALEPLARPHSADDTRFGGQRTADALAELARRALEGGRLPQTGGVRPQLLVTVDLDSLAGRPGGLGGDLGWAGPLDPAACRRLACDGAVTRVLATRHRDGHQPLADDGGHPDADHGPSGDRDTPAPSGEDGLPGRLQAAMTPAPPDPGRRAQPAPRGGPGHPGGCSRPQRMALAVRGGGCVFPGCDRPLSWCDAHHLQHWVRTAAPPT